MRCEEVIPELPSFLDGELSPGERDALSAHLAGCTACEAERASVARTIARVRALPRAAAPASLVGAVAARLLGVAPSGETPGVKPATCGALEAADLSAFLDGELPEAARDRTREHIAVCPSCAETLVWLDDVSGRVRVLPRVSAPANLLAIVLARIEDLLARAPAPAAGPAAAPTPPKTWSRVTRASRLREPIQFPPAVKRFLAAASVLVLALGSLAVATPVATTEVPDGVYATELPKIPQGTGPVTEVDKVVLPTANPDHLMAVACNDPARAETVFLAFFAGANVRTFPTKDKNTLGLTGSVQDLRRTLKQLPEACALEDVSRLDELLPAPLDQVFTRNGEVLQGFVERQDPQAVVLATSVRPPGSNETDRPDASHRALTLMIPRRSVVRVKPASHEPVTVYILLRRRSE